MLRRHPSTKASFSMVTVKEHNDKDTMRGRMNPATQTKETVLLVLTLQSLSDLEVGLRWLRRVMCWWSDCPTLYRQDKQLVILSANSAIMKAWHVGKHPSCGLQGVVKEDQGCEPHLTFMVWKHANNKRTHKPVDFKTCGNQSCVVPPGRQLNSSAINEVQSHSHALPKPHLSSH